MRFLKWSTVGLVLGLLVCSLAPAALAQVPPNVWHPYLGAPNCIQVGDSRGNFNCFPGITIDPVTGAVGGLAGGGTVSTSGSPAANQTAVFSSGAIITGVGPGTSGQVLTSNGAGVNPSYQTLAGGGNLSATTPTNHGVMLGQGTQNLGVTGTGSAGQVLTSNGAGADPTFQAGGGGLTIGGSNTQLQYNNSGALGGVTGATTNGTIVTLTSPVFVTPALGTPASGVLTNATGLPLTTGVTGTLPVANGGTGATTLTIHGVLVGNTTGAVQATSAGTAGQCLTSNGASSDPTFQSCGAGGGVTTTGSPASGQVSVMSGANSITSTSGLTSSAGALTATGTITGNALVSAGAADGSLKLTNVTGSGFSTTLTGGNPAANRTYRLPIIDGSANQFLQTDGSGNWSFAAASGGGTVTTTGSPANGNLAAFSGATSIVNTNLTGDVTTTNTVATTIAANAVTSAKMAVVNTRRTCTIVIGADNGSALANADIGPQLDQCLVNGAGTVVEVMVKADAGTPTALPQVRSVANSPTNLLSGALSTGSSGARACSNTGGTTSIDGTTTCTNTLTTTALAAGVTLGITSGVAGGTAKRLSVAITYTVN